MYMMLFLIMLFFSALTWMSIREIKALQSQRITSVSIPTPTPTPTPYPSQGATMPDAPMDVLYLGASLDEVRANCRDLIGDFHSALFNWEEMEFFPVCIVDDRYYKVYVPEEELPKKPCMPMLPEELAEAKKAGYCDNF